MVKFTIQRHINTSLQCWRTIWWWPMLREACKAVSSYLYIELVTRIGIIIHLNINLCDWSRCLWQDKFLLLDALRMRLIVAEFWAHTRSCVCHLLCSSDPIIQLALRSGFMRTADGVTAFSPILWTIGSFVTVGEAAKFLTILLSPSSWYEIKDNEWPNVLWTNSTCSMKI